MRSMGLCCLILIIHLFQPIAGQAALIGFSDASIQQNGQIAGSIVSWDIILHPDMGLYQDGGKGPWLPLDLGGATSARFILSNMQLENGSASIVPGYEAFDCFEAVRGTLQIDMGSSRLIAQIGDIDRVSTTLADTQLAGSWFGVPPDGQEDFLSIRNLDSQRITTATGVFSSFAEPDSKFNLDASLSGFLGSSDITPTSFGNGIATFGVHNVRISTTSVPEPCSALLVLSGIPLLRCACKKRAFRDLRQQKKI